MKTLVIKSRRSMRGSDASERDSTLVEAIRSLDRAAAKRVLHPNNAARRKSRLARQVAKLAAAEPAPVKGKKGAAAPAAAAKKK